MVSRWFTGSWFKSIRTGVVISIAGVYVKGNKVGSVGIRIRRGASYHGLALNVDMDLEPFQRINPCGYAGLQMTQLAALAKTPATIEEVGRAFARSSRTR